MAVVDWLVNFVLSSGPDWNLVMHKYQIDIPNALASQFDETWVYMMTDGVFLRQRADNKHIISQIISPHSVPYPPSCWMIYKKDFYRRCEIITLLYWQILLCRGRALSCCGPWTELKISDLLQFVKSNHC